MSDDPKEFFEIRVSFHASEAEAHELMELVSAIACGGSGDGDAHVCKRDFLVALTRVSDL